MTGTNSKHLLYTWRIIQNTKHTFSIYKLSSKEDALYKRWKYQIHFHGNWNEPLCHS